MVSLRFTSGGGKGLGKAKKCNAFRGCSKCLLDCSLMVKTLSKYRLSKATMYLDVDTIEWMLGMLFNDIT